MSAKEGSFDWIVDTDKILSFLSFEFTGISVENKCNSTVLIVGCGTSILSEEVYKQGFGQVISIDNDKECIEYMKQKYISNSQLKWFTYDLITGENDCPEEYINQGFYDLIIDKGTLDACLVEGSVYTMLACIYRFLNNTTGRYIVCSLYSQSMMLALLGTLSLGYLVNVYQTAASINEVGFACMQGNIFICKKKHQDITIDNAIDLHSLKLEEKDIMDHHFQEEKPLLTKERENQIKGFFYSNNISSSTTDDYDEIVVDIRDAHRGLFSGEDDGLLEYSFDLFLEDLQTFGLRREGCMSLQEALEFVRVMQ